MMNIVAPCPQKPTSLLPQHHRWNSISVQKEDDDACFELRQILFSQGNNTMNRFYSSLRLEDDPISTRTNHPLPSLTPLHHGDYPTTAANNSEQYRPRSLSVGNARPVVNLVL